MSLLTLFPLLLSILVATVTALYVLKRDTLARSLCVQTAYHLQAQLKKELESLLKLNPKARRLRQLRQKADEGLRRALASGNPKAIAAAKVFQQMVILQQKALRAKQKSHLSAAALARREFHQKLSQATRRWKFGAPHSTSNDSLAVRAVPATSLTPDYLPESNFEKRQQHRFRFAVHLQPPFNFGDLKTTTHKMDCAVTLTGKEGSWRLQSLPPEANRLWR